MVDCTFINYKNILKEELIALKSYIINVNQETYFLLICEIKSLIIQHIHSVGCLYSIPKSRVCERIKGDVSLTASAQFGFKLDIG